jgi:hypothetical protein
MILRGSLRENISKNNGAYAIEGYLGGDASQRSIRVPFLGVKQKRVHLFGLSFVA